MTSLSYIDAVREMCRTWGAQKRYMLTSKEQGWNAASLIARFKELQDAAGSGTQRVGQFQEEAHTGEGLLVSRALRGGAPEKVNLIVHAHYVPRGKAKQKAFYLGVSVAEYWRDLENAHYWLAAKLPIVDTAVETKRAG